MRRLLICLSFAAALATFQGPAAGHAQEPGTDTATATTAAAQTPVATVAPSTPEAPGTISGSVIGPFDLGQSLPIVVVEADAEQPIRLGVYGEAQDSPVGRRAGAGLLRSDGDGGFEVTGLAPGAYLVILVAPISGIESPSGATVEAEYRGNVLANPAEVVNVVSASTVEVRFASPVPPAPTGPAGIRIHAQVSDGGMDPPRVDPVTSVELTPFPDGAEVILEEDGSATVRNLPAGQYKVVIRTKAGVSFPTEVLLAPEEIRDVRFIFSPALLGGGIALPSTGQASSSGADPLVIGAALVLASVVAAGVVATVRRKAR